MAPWIVSRIVTQNWILAKPGAAAPAGPRAEGRRAPCARAAGERFRQKVTGGFGASTWRWSMPRSPSRWWGPSDDSFPRWDGRRSVRASRGCFGAPGILFAFQRFPRSLGAPGGRWGFDRFHSAVNDGVASNQKRFLFAKIRPGGRRALGHVVVDAPQRRSFVLGVRGRSPGAGRGRGLPPASSGGHLVARFFGSADPLFGVDPGPGVEREGPGESFSRGERLFSIVRKSSRVGFQAFSAAGSRGRAIFVEAEEGSATPRVWTALSWTSKRSFCGSRVAMFGCGGVPSSLGRRR